MSCPRCGTPIPVISFSQDPLYRCQGCSSRFKRQGRSLVTSSMMASESIPLPPSVAKMTGCPSCGAPKQSADQSITLNDGGSILCWRCGTAYHICARGEARTGFTPLTCPYCCESQQQQQTGNRREGDYLGNLYTGKVEKPEGDYVGDFCVKRY